MREVHLAFEQLERRDAPAILLVTSDEDSGAGTLRQAVADASSGDTIQFDLLNYPAPEFSIYLQSQIETDKSLTIDGQGYDKIVQIRSSPPISTRLFSFHDDHAAVNVTIRYVTFISGNATQYTDDFAGNYGGAIYVRGSLNVYGCEFRSSTAEYGGAIAISPLSPADTLTISWSSFRFNRALRSGGALYYSPDNLSLTGGDITIGGSLFTENSALDGSGGAIEAVQWASANASMIITDSVFRGNYASVFGGAVSTNYNLTVFGVEDPRSEFANNEASYGGAISWSATPINVSRSLTLICVSFVSNRAIRGGALHIHSIASSGTISELIAGCLFDSNLAGQGTDPSMNFGGGIYVDNTTSENAVADLTMVNSTLTRNSTIGSGGGIYVTTVNNGTGWNSVGIFSDTIYQNLAVNEGGGVWAHPCCDVQVWNSIIAGNLVGGDLIGLGGSSDMSGIFDSVGCNLIGTRQGNDQSNWNATDQIQQVGGAARDPGLDPNGLQNNGGFTKTIAVLATSIAYRSGDLNLWGTYDQRGYWRMGLVFMEGPVVTRGAYDPDALQAPIVQD